MFRRVENEHAVFDGIIIAVCVIYVAVLVTAVYVWPWVSSFFGGLL